VLVKKGKNTLLFHLGADKLQARLAAAPEKAVFIDDKDRTLPTLVRGEKKPDWVWAAVPIINATRDWIDDAKIDCVPKDGEPRPTPITPLPPLSVRKVAFQVPTGGDESNNEPHFQIRGKNRTPRRLTSRSRKAISSSSASDQVTSRSARSAAASTAAYSTTPCDQPRSSRPTLTRPQPA
jgi:hypothetical protein